MQPVDKLSQGEIFWDGELISQIDTFKLACVRAYASQNPQASDDWLAIDVVKAGAWPWVRAKKILGRSYQDELEDLITKVLIQCDIEGIQNRRWKYLSGGERQRISLAASLAQQTPVLILDEPTSHLDLGHQFKFIDQLIKPIDSQKIFMDILIATIHDLQLFTRGFTHVLALNGDSDASWVAGTVQEVLTPQRVEYALGHSVSWVQKTDGQRVLIPN